MCITLPSVSILIKSSFSLHPSPRLQWFPSQFIIDPNILIYVLSSVITVFLIQTSEGGARDLLRELLSIHVVCASSTCKHIRYKIFRRDAQKLLVGLFVSVSRCSSWWIWGQCFALQARLQWKCLYFHRTYLLSSNISSDSQRNHCNEAKQLMSRNRSEGLGVFACVRQLCRFLHCKSSWLTAIPPGGTPSLVSSQRLSRVGPGLYLDGRLPGNTRCCKLGVAVSQPVE